MGQYDLHVLQYSSPNAPTDATGDINYEQHMVEMYSSTGSSAQSSPNRSTINMQTESEPGDMLFCMSNYAQETLKMLYMMRSHHMLTDVVLEVQQELFHAHKVVLSAASPYFKAMFTSGLRESEMSRVKLLGVCPTAMARILYFMYSGRIRVTEVTVCQLLPAATMFQVPNVIDACCAFLERQLDPTNAIGIARFAEQHGCTGLKQSANQFIERHFTQICQEEEFLQLSAIQIIELIRKDELNVQEERDVYNAVLKWVKYDEDSRYPKMEHILYGVRCQLLTPRFLNEQMRTCDLLKKAPACREYLSRIFTDLTLHKRCVVRERTPNTTRMILVTGGYWRQSLDIVEGFDVDKGTWIQLPKLRVPRSGLGAGFLKGCYFAVGGRNNAPGSSYDSDWVDRYNPLAESWIPCSPMSVPRNRVGVAVMDGLLYALGGSSGNEYHRVVENFDPDKDKWTCVAPMHQKRLGVGVAVVNRLLYAIGGYDGENRLNSVECYHPENNEWTVLAPLTFERSGAGVAAIKQYIYVVGGFDGTRQLSSVERYDTEQHCWDMVAALPVPRSALTVTALDGKLYAMGGFNGTEFVNNVDVYDSETNQWESGVPLPSCRSGHAAAVLYQPSCIVSGYEGSSKDGTDEDGQGGSKSDSNKTNDGDGKLNGSSLPDSNSSNDINMFELDGSLNGPTERESISLTGNCYSMDDKSFEMDPNDDTDIKSASIWYDMDEQSFDISPIASRKVRDHLIDQPTKHCNDSKVDHPKKSRRKAGTEQCSVTKMNVAIKTNINNFMETMATKRVACQTKRGNCSAGKCFLSKFMRRKP